MCPFFREMRCGSRGSRQFAVPIVLTAKCCAKSSASKGSMTSGLKKPEFRTARSIGPSRSVISSTACFVTDRSVTSRDTGGCVRTCLAFRQLLLAVPTHGARWRPQPNLLSKDSKPALCRSQNGDRLPMRCHGVPHLSSTSDPLLLFVVGMAVDTSAIGSPRIVSMGRQPSRATRRVGAFARRNRDRAFGVILQVSRSDQSGSEGTRAVDTLFPQTGPFRIVRPDPSWAFDKKALRRAGRLLTLRSDE